MLKYLSVYTFLFLTEIKSVANEKGSTHGLFYSCKLRDWKEARRGLKKGLPEGCGTIFYEHQQEWRAGEPVVVFALQFLFFISFIY